MPVLTAGGGFPEFQNRRGAQRYKDLVAQAFLPVWILPEHRQDACATNRSLTVAALFGAGFSVLREWPFAACRAVVQICDSRN
jgi:hypothetical protein